MDITTHVGAYAIIKAAPVEISYTERGCPTHGRPRHEVGNYCPKCGQPIIDLQRVDTRRAKLDDLLPNHDEAFYSPWDIEDIEDDEFVIIGNRGERQGRIPKADAIEVTDTDIDRCKADFADTYAKELAALTKVAKSVTVKFGVVRYCV